MKILRSKFFSYTLTILILIGFSYYYRENISTYLSLIANQLQPCQRPITYSIESLDPRFGLTKTELLNDIAQAEKIWEAPINKQLFQYSPTGDLKISFVYDYRQKATDALRKIGIVINDDKSTYDVLKAKYDSLLAAYNIDKRQLEALVATYNTDKDAYDKDVSYWNKRGGAQKTEYNILEQKRIDLNNQVTVINQSENSLNALIDTINSVEIVLNKLVTELNLKIDTYNTTGSSATKQFSEGEYIRDTSGTAINIFEFGDNNQLMKVLAHELGHALGLGHLDNPKAIMYYLNEGMNQKLTADDLAALKKICGIK